VDLGTNEYIEADQIQELTRLPTLEVVHGGDSKNMLILFILNYARHAAPSEELKDDLAKELKKAGSEEGQHTHRCHLDFLTFSDVAFAMWHYINSQEDWVRKLRNPTLKNKHNTKWTSDKTGKKMSEGYKEYKRLEKWCEQLKLMSKQGPDTEERKGYELLRVACNVKAKAKGLMMAKSTVTLSESEQVEEMDAEQAVGFNFDELVEVGGDCD